LGVSAVIVNPSIGCGGGGLARMPALGACYQAYQGTGRGSGGGGTVAATSSMTG